MANRICYLEIIANDQPAMRGFYSKLFGWEMTPSGENYTMFNDGNGFDGGLSPAMPGIEHGACIYVEVDDIDATLQEIGAAGGETVLEKTKISDEYGSYALFRDPGGNVMGVWSQG